MSQEFPNNFGTVLEYEPEKQNKQEGENELSEALLQTIEKLPYNAFYPNEIPYIIETFETMGLNIKDIAQSIKKYGEHITDKNDREQTRSLSKFIQHLLYPIATNYCLGENKKGVVLDDLPSVIMKPQSERRSPDIPLGIRVGLQGNLIGYLEHLIRKENNPIPEDLKKRILTWAEKTHKRARAKFDRTFVKKSKKETLKDERHDLEEQFFFEKTFFDLFYKNQVKIDGLE